MTTFKGYCWSLGTTSFRTQEQNKKIEKQLDLIKKFRDIDEYQEEWSGNKELQTNYYNFLKENGFLTGDASRPEKDAREKTSGLVDIGLIDKNRRITEAGLAILETSYSNNYKSDNILSIEKDSYIYLKQLLKSSNDVGGNIVRPLIILLKTLSEFNFLTKDEFTYLLPLCIDQKKLDLIVSRIREGRAKGRPVVMSVVITDIFMGMPNYKEAFKIFNSATKITESIVCNIGMNRKSPKYDKAYFPFYNNLKAVLVDKDESKVLPLFENIKKFSSSHLRVSWKKLLFKSASEKIIKKEKLNTINSGLFNIKDFKEFFFVHLHLFKIKANLNDYSDLNKRYLKLTDVFIFEDNLIKLDIIPMAFFKENVNFIEKESFKSSSELTQNTNIESIFNGIKMDEESLYKELSSEFSIEVKNKEQAQNYIKEKRYSRLDKLLSNELSKENLIILLDLFDKRDDGKIKEMITDNADIPTLFEYILGISWYLISEKDGDILEYMNLSLDPNLLPKSHASGGGADIVYKYKENSSYPKHALLIEATLSNKVNQRRMEMEPVSRHLGNYLLENRGEEAYCIFSSTHLDTNVIADFRNRAKNIYYSSKNEEDFIEGMKIIPLETKIIKNILEKDIKYRQIYPVLEKAFSVSDKPPKKWYDEEIYNKLS